MRVAILGDTHFGVRNDSELFLEMQQRYYTEFFFPYLKENGIDVLIQTGDIFDKRKNINIRTLNKAKQFFFDAVLEWGGQFMVIVGNHDTYYKNTNDLNSLNTLIEENPKYKDFLIVSEFQREILDGVEFNLVAWVNEENHDAIIEQLEYGKDVCIGHFELSGFEMMRGVVSKHGTLDAKKLSDFDVVFSGHYHRPSEKGNIVYIGTPYQLTWTDYGDEKSFVVFDTKSKTYERVYTPTEYNLYAKVKWQDALNSPDMSGKIVRVLVDDQTPFSKLNAIMEKAGCHDYEYVAPQTTQKSDVEELSEIEGPFDILLEYIEQAEENPKKQKMYKRLAQKVYEQAVEQMADAQ